MVTSIGWLAILAFTLSMFMLWTFSARLNRKVQNVIDEEYAIENGYHQDISDYDDDVKDDTDG